MWEDVRAGTTEELGDFVLGAYVSQVHNSDSGHVQANLEREGTVEDIPIRVTKKVSLNEGENALLVDYLLEQLPPDRPFHFAVEWNFAGMPAGADDRYFYDVSQQSLGELGNQLDLRETTGIGLVDRWLGIDVGLSCNRPTNIWAFPIATVSQSEGGFEAVHQSVAVMPHWLIAADAEGQWGVTMRLSLQTLKQQVQQETDQTTSTIR